MLSCTPTQHNNKKIKENSDKLGMWDTPVISTTRDAEAEGLQF
jgi:hypothetical protein